MKRLKFFILVLLIGALAACSSSSVTVRALFSNTVNINEGSPVYLDDLPVGKITSVDVFEQQTQVEISLDEQHAHLVSNKAAVVVNRLKQGAPIELYNRGQVTEPVESGQQLKGLDSMFQLGAWMVGDSIQLGAGSLSDYVEGFQKYLDSDQFEKDKTVMQEQITSAAESAQQAIQSVGKEVEDAVKDMVGSEQKMADSVGQLGEELSPLVEELTRSGVAIVQELEKLTQGLQNAGEDEQVAGEKFMQSLLEALEKLNQSVESGLTEPQAEQQNKAK